DLSANYMIFIGKLLKLMTLRLRQHRAEIDGLLKRQKTPQRLDRKPRLFNLIFEYSPHMAGTVSVLSW
ncbi:MAG: hypothetical protein ACKVK5_18565, partial [Pseudomonadales bacterium]